MPPRPRVVCTSVLAAALLALLATSVPAGAASAPELRGATFARPAIAGRVATLELRALDAERPVSGAVVAFAGEGGHGTSTCRAGARANRPVTITVPHRFAAAGPRAMVVRVETAGCRGGGAATVQPFTATPVEPGEEPIEPSPSGPAAEIIGGLPDPPPVPGVPEAPAPVLPALPGVTAPDPLAGLPRARAARACRGAHRRPGRRNGAVIRRAALCLVNAERVAHRLRPLRHDPRLSRAARAHARDMIARRYFAHVSPGGHGLVLRLRASRWLPRPPGWSAGENIGFGETVLSTPAATVKGWMESTGHRENTLRRSWRLAGFAAVAGMPFDGVSGATWVAVFAHR